MYSVFSMLPYMKAVNLTLRCYQPTIQFHLGHISSYPEKGIFKDTDANLELLFDSVVNYFFFVQFVLERWRALPVFSLWLPSNREHRKTLYRRESLLTIKRSGGSSSPCSSWMTVCDEEKQQRNNHFQTADGSKSMLSFASLPRCISLTSFGYHSAMSLCKSTS